MGFLQITARVGSAFAPWAVTWLAVFDVAIPFTLMGVLSLLASFACMALSETRDLKTRESTDQILGPPSNKHVNALIVENEINSKV